MEIIDTHLHIWDANEFEIPWLKGVNGLLSEKYTLLDYENAIKNDGTYTIKKAIYVEVDVDVNQKEKEAECIKKICKANDTIIKGAIISGDLLNESFMLYIDKFSHSAIKGVRHVLHTDFSPKGICLKPQFIKNVKYLGEKNFCLKVACEQRS